MPIKSGIFTLVVRNLFTIQHIGLVFCELKIQRGRQDNLVVEINQRNKRNPYYRTLGQVLSLSAFYFNDITAYETQIK